MTDSRLQRATDLLALGRHRDVLDLTSAMLAELPDSGEVHLVRGWALLALGEGIEAAKTAERSLALDPGSDAGHRLRALGLVEAGFPNFAVGPARQAVALSAWEPANHAVLAMALRETGELFTAWEAAERAIELDPNDADWHVLMGNIASAYPAPDVASAAYRRALELDPGNAEALHNLTAETMSRGDSPLAGIRGFTSTLALDAQIPEAQANLDKISVYLLQVVRWAGALVLLVGTFCYFLGAPRVGAVLAGALLAVVLVVWAALPRDFRRSRLTRLARDTRFRAATIVNVGATALFVAVAVALAVAPAGATAPPAFSSLFLPLWGLVQWGLGAWTNHLMDVP